MFSLRRETWEVPDVDLRLSDEQRAVRETFAALFRKESTPQRVRIAESTGIDKALWQSYAQVEALGIGIPSDLSVIGFDDIRLAQFVLPALTTVQMSQADLARLAFQIGRASCRERVCT